MGVTSIAGAGIAGASGSIHSAIALASQRTGIDFNYLLGQAQIESGLNATAKAATSSARGLYQFVEQSWLGVVKAHGAEYGLGWAADAIQKSGGRYTVSGGLKQAILGLRTDPAVASAMAAEHASDNKAGLESELGRSATPTDLYMAHFLGLGGAKTFLSAMESNPGRSGAALLPAAAHANHSVFYTASGAPRTLSDIYNHFADKLQDASATPTPAAAPSAVPATMLLAGGAEVIPGSAASTDDAVVWAQSTLDRLNAGASQTASNLLRPTPDTARLAYLMLATMGA